MKMRPKCQSARSMSWAVKKVFSQAEVRCDGLKATIVISRSSFLLEEPKRRISRGYCRGIGPRSSLSIYVLGPKPKPRTRDRPRRGKRYQGSPCQWMTRSILVIMAQEGKPRTNVTSDNQNQGSNRWSTIQKDVLGSFAGTDKPCKNKVQRGVLKCLRRKLLPLH